MRPAPLLFAFFPLTVRIKRKNVKFASEIVGKMWNFKLKQPEKCAEHILKQPEFCGILLLQQMKAVFL